MHEYLAGLLNGQLRLLENIVNGFTPEKFIATPPTRKWSAHANLAHLVRYQQVFHERVSRILREEAPQIARYVAEQDEQFPSWLAKDREELLATYYKDRDITNKLLEQLQEHAARIGDHPKLGRMTLKGWFDFFILHESHHIYTMFQLK